jgi:hypothetical protein
MNDYLLAALISFVVLALSQTAKKYLKKMIFRSSGYRGS